METLDTLEQGPGQRTEPGADLDDDIPPLGIDRGDDPLDVMPVGEEVLAEALAGLMEQRASGLRIEH